MQRMLDLMFESMEYMYHKHPSHIVGPALAERVIRAYTIQPMRSPCPEVGL
jgi:hypothetical protein